MPPRDESAAYALDDAILFSRILASYRSEPLTEAFDAYETLRRDRIKEWMMTFHLKTNENAREAAWAFDATKMALPTPAPSEDLVSLNSFLRDRTI